MSISMGRARFSVLELVLTLTVMALLGSLIFPVLSHAQDNSQRTRSLRATCTSQQRQIATAICMYCQDNNAFYPGIDKTSWTSKLENYLGAAREMFHCPADPAEDPVVSYGLSGLLIGPDGKGVKEARVKSPSEVGAVCDATPSRPFPQGGLVYGGGLQPNREVAVMPDDTRHGGIIAGFCDGHAKFYEGTYRQQDMGDGVARAFIQASPVGLIDNPLGCVSAFTTPGLTRGQFNLTIGGEYCTSPLLMAAAQYWGAYDTKGFCGQYVEENRHEAFIWGTGDGVEPPQPSVPLARDAVVFIIARGSRIHGFGSQENETCIVNYATIRKLFRAGYRQNEVQAYSLSPKSSGTHHFLERKISQGENRFTLGADTIMLANDLDMVEKVANDPYGIGYCSSVFADPQRVTILALKTPDDKVYTFPQTGPDSRWELPDTPDWPLTRTLYAQFGGKTWIDNKPCPGSMLLAPASPGMRALQAGPLFKMGYFRP